ncbi:MAG: hypothetical protein Q8941_20530 [Bacteroidota bacterium]|nr:hypothetical protein [Bacteroidota bacterium]
MSLTPEQLNRIDEQVFEIVPVYQNEDQFCATRKRTVKDLRNLIRQNLIDKTINEMSSPIKEIKHISINTDHPDIANAENIDALVRLNIFDKLPKDEQDIAYQELWDHLRQGKIKLANPSVLNEPVKDYGDEK